MYLPFRFIQYRPLYGPNHNSFAIIDQKLRKLIFLKDFYFFKFLIPRGQWDLPGCPSAPLWLFLTFNYQKYPIIARSLKVEERVRTYIFSI